MRWNTGRGGRALLVHLDEALLVHLDEIVAPGARATAWQSAR
jgi:hypothetical protein